MNQQPPNQPPNQQPGQGGPVARQKPASLAVYKRELRRQLRKKDQGPEINFLNITAMLDMMTIILVFLLKSLSQSSASIPQSKDLTMPTSTLTTEATEEGLAVLISKTNIVVDDNAVVPVPADPTHGIEAKYKRSGANDLYIVPLANALQSWREKDRQIRASTGKDSTSSEAKIIADADTPYRLLVEVLFTLGQSEYGTFHLMVLQGAKKT